jgi:hypothetical protein
MAAGAAAGAVMAAGAVRAVEAVRAAEAAGPLRPFSWIETTKSLIWILFWILSWIFKIFT